MSALNNRQIIDQYDQLNTNIAEDLLMLVTPGVLVSILNHIYKTYYFPFVTQEKSGYPCRIRIGSLAIPNAKLRKLAQKGIDTLSEDFVQDTVEYLDISAMYPV